MCLTDKVYACFTHLGSTVSVQVFPDFIFENVLKAPQCSAGSEEQEVLVFLVLSLLVRDRANWMT